MSESKSSVLNIRLAPDVLALLTARANVERRPIRQMAALLIRDALLPAARPLAPIDPTRHHAAGPVLASAVPSVAGVATGFHPKASWNPKTKKGGGNE